MSTPRPRLEDRRFLIGAGRYLADLHDADLVAAVFVRSPYAHAEIVSIDASAAAAVDGVLAVLTGEDWRADGLGPIPTRTAAKSKDGAPALTPERPGLAVGRARFVGDAVALVVARSESVARDAAQLVEVAYQPLEAVVSAAAALEDGAPLVWPEFGTNLCVDYEHGDAAACEAAFAAAAHVVEIEVENQRVVALPIETRGAIARYEAASGLYTLDASTQNVHANRDDLAKVLGVASDQLRLRAPDVGGGFGVKNGVYPEYAAVLWAARRVGRPVRWIADRSEGFLSDAHGRDQRSRAALALDADGGFLGLRVRSTSPIGAYVMTVGPFTPTGGSARTQGGPYRIPALHFTSKAAFTHMSPVEPYRGAGRPEASYMLERLIDAAAAELGLDRIALRRRNLLRPDELPATTAAGLLIDSGDFPRQLEIALDASDWAGFAARARASEARGRRRGFGVACYLECTGGGPNEHASITFEADGRAVLSVGSQSTGMGHETVLVDLVADRLGLDRGAIDYRQADTRATPRGGGHGGSRTLEVAGPAVLGAVEKAVAKGKALAGHLLEVGVADLVFEAGRYRVSGADVSIAFDEVARAAQDPSRRPAGFDGLDAAEDHARARISTPNGCHVAEVEVDPETGLVRLARFVAVDDAGRVLNHQTAEGQVAGGAVQGIGQALFEQVVYDADGQLITGSLMDYAAPRAADLPWIEARFFEETPTEANPLGVKGAGEAGCCGAPPALVNAAIDALRPLGVRALDMPLTPARVWAAIQAVQ
ncbi:MAG: xanthine dehydrogenase family protein molybdopterin-binding subunit [Pseudomonadota bacterium]